MEKSENYYTRQEYMKELKIPTFRKIKDVLGENLGNAVIGECPVVLRKELGTEPKLHGAGDTLWTSPSDLLEGLVVLKPPFTNRYIKALMHQGILSIGMEIENKFRNEMEQKCKHALSEQEEMLLFIAEQERIKAVRDALADRIKYYEEKFESFENDFEKRLQEELELLTTRLLEDNTHVLELQREEMEAEWQDILSATVEETTKSLTIKFLEELENQQLALTRKFAFELKKLEAKHEINLELEQAICKETLKQLKHNLECKNISNLVYVLCMERRKCEQNRLETQNQYDEEITKVCNHAEACESSIVALKKALKHEQERIVIREQCLKEILKQFQKFVYFALKAAPTQGEFLLNIEKLLLYELAETVSNLGNRTKGMRVLLRKRSPSEQEHLTPQSLTLPEDHNCLDELDPPDYVPEELFSVIFNDKLYVREDFRNMVSQGISIRPSNELWHNDVEELIKRLKTSIEDETSGKKSTRRNSPVQMSMGIAIDNGTSSVTHRNHTESIRVKPEQKLQGSSVNGDNVDFFIPDVSSRPDHESRRSSVYFVGSKVSDHDCKKKSDLTDIQAIQSTQQQLLSEMLMQSEPVDVNNIMQVVETHRTHSMLLCAKDSLEHHRMSLRTGSLRDDVDLAEITSFRQRVLNKHQEDNPALGSRKSSDTFRTTPPLSHTPDKTKRKKKEEVDIVEVHQPFKKMLSNRLVDEGILHETEVANTKEVIQVKDVKQQLSITPKERRYSGLSLAQDSLEIIKSKTVIKEVLKQNFITALHELSTPALPSKTKYVSPEMSTISKKDRVSIMETVIEINVLTPSAGQVKRSARSASDESAIAFKPLPKTYHTGSIIVNPDQTWRVYEHHYVEPQDADKANDQMKHRKIDIEAQEQRDIFIDKENVGRIVGSDQAIQMRSTAFTVDRVHSLLTMLKEDPSLMRIFTACSR